MFKSIARLQRSHAAQSREIDALRAGLREFREHLATAEVSGTERAWMPVRDIEARLNWIERTAMEAHHTPPAAVR